MFPCMYASVSQMDTVCRGRSGRVWVLLELELQTIVNNHPFLYCVLRFRMLYLPLCLPGLQACQGGTAANKLLVM